MQAVKNIFRFMAWQWRQLHIIPKLAFVSIFSVLLSAATMQFVIVSNTFFAIGVLGIASMFVTLFYTIIKEQYAKYKAERQELFNQIKNSDSPNWKNGGGGTQV